MCDEANITINPSKVRIGHTEETWYGYTINQGKISPSERNLDPIKRMEYPKNKSELRSVLGVFNQLTHFIPDYNKGKNSPAAILCLQKVNSCINKCLPDNLAPLLCAQVSCVIYDGS